MIYFMAPLVVTFIMVHDDLSTWRKTKRQEDCNVFCERLFMGLLASITTSLLIWISK